jgi:aerobic-type carbon monoxide dehydrogenase small subunit (CoxS/CutS family)
VRFVEGSMDPWVCCFVDPEFVVSAADVLDERMPGTDHAGAAEMSRSVNRCTQR